MMPNEQNAQEDGGADEATRSEIEEADAEPVVIEEADAEPTAGEPEVITGPVGIEEADAEPAVTETEPPSEPAVAEPGPPSAPASVEPEPTTTELSPRRSPISWWPYLLYLAAWIALVVATVVLLTGEQADIPSVRQDAYPFLVLAGLLLTLLGPLLSVTIWVFVWARTPKAHRGGLFTTAFLRGAILTFAGVLLWWGALVTVDALRLGLI